MEKIWSIDGKDFTNREEAKKFLATAWKENPVEYLDDYDMTSDFEEYLTYHNKIDLHMWLLELSVCNNAKSIEKKIIELQKFIDEFIDMAVEDAVDEWLTEEIEEE